MKFLQEKINQIAENTLDHYLNSITRKRYVEDVEKIIQVCKDAEPSAPDFVLINRLAAVYQPSHRGIISALEIEQVKGCLEIERRTVLSLRNLRNAVVMMMNSFGDEAMDKISGITCVIDSELLDRGEEI